MVFKRRGARTYAFQARRPDGTYQQIQTPAPLTAQGKGMAQRIEAMWNALALEHRAWDLLTPVLDASRGERAAKLGRLFDLWTATRYSVPEMRRLLSDVNLEPLVAPYLLAHSRGVGAGSAAHVRLYLRTLIPADKPCPLSRVTPAWLTDQLAAYPGSRSTRRSVASAWAGFLEHCAHVHGLFQVNPMAKVTRPAQRRASADFHDSATVQRIVYASGDVRRRVLMAVLYGTGIEISVALRLTRADVWSESQEINAAGTKTHTRHRVAMVADWAWPMLAEYVRDLLPTARLFPAWRPEAVSKWHHHLQAKVLQLPRVRRLHAARHHWAVTNLRAGVPVAVVQHQLGHASATMTLDVYGAFMPSGADRAHWRQQVAQAEAKRAESGERSATGGAMAGEPKRGKA
jgi:integrase